MVKTIQGQLIAKNKKFGIVASRFNDFITKKLLEGAVDTLIRHGAKETEIEAVWVPGSFEVPFAANKMAKSKKFDAVICLGTVISGSTPHFEYISSEVAKGIAKVGLDTGTPTIFGIITADTLEQAIERAGTKSGNKGFDAAMSAIEMADLFRKINGPVKKNGISPDTLFVESDGKSSLWPFPRLININPDSIRFNDHKRLR